MSDDATAGTINAQVIDPGDALPTATMQPRGQFPAIAARLRAGLYSNVERQNRAVNDLLRVAEERTRLLEMQAAREAAALKDLQADLGAITDE